MKVNQGKSVIWLFLNKIPLSAAILTRRDVFIYIVFRIILKNNAISLLPCFSLIKTVIDLNVGNLGQSRRNKVVIKSLQKVVTFAHKSLEQSMALSAL